MKLDELRDQWEEGLFPLSVIEYTWGHLVVLQDKQKKYHLHRYFSFDPIVGWDKWEVSVDGREVDLNAVWKWLEDPRAIERE